VGACAAGLWAKLCAFVGVNALVIAAPLAAIGCAAWDAYRSNKYLRVVSARPGSNNFAGETNESEERFRSAFDYAAIGMALVSADGRWLQVNQSLCRLLDYTERELQATDLLTVIHHDEVGAVFENIKRLTK